MAAGDPPRELRPASVSHPIEAIREHLIAAGLDPRVPDTASDHADDHHWIRAERERRERRSRWSGGFIAAAIVAMITWLLTYFGPFLARLSVLPPPKP